MTTVAVPSGPEPAGPHLERRDAAGTATDAADDAPGAFEDLFHAEYEPMVRVAFLMLGSRQEAEDVAQDAFAQVHLRWSRLTHPAGYLRRSVVNGCLDILRRRDLARRADRLRVVDTTDLGADEMSDALAALPERQRAALILRYHEDLRDHEIAAALGVRPGTAKSLVHRALARLREVIER
jgi:RNA polymerase sigma factor (sigma-70 family)